MVNSLYTNMSRLDTLYNQMNSLKKIQRPSDDPIIAGRSLKLRINVLEAEQYKSNTDEATSWMEITEKALGNVTEILKQINTRCVQASTDTLATEDREKIEAEINQLWEQLQQEANVTYAGRCVFSGYKTDEPPVLTKETTLTQPTELESDLILLKGTKVSADVLDGGGTVLIAAGTTLTEDITIPAGATLPTNTVLPKGTINPNVLGKIDEQNIQYEVGVGSTISVNTLGMDRLMSKLFADIKEIKDGLESHSDSDTSNDVNLHDLFEGKIGDFADRLLDVSTMTADLGSRVNRLEYTATRLVDDKTNFTELLSKTEDVDLEEVYVEFNSQYAVYQSALQATSKVIMNTLADFLR
jgi:flagellar hook-associated protein 3 FlgL